MPVLVIAEHDNLKLKAFSLNAINAASKIDSDMGDNFETGMKMVKDSVDMIFTSEETHERDTISEKELEEWIKQQQDKRHNQ